MKKIIWSSLAVLGIATVFSSCLKDDEYGTNIVEHKGVAFTQAKPLSPNILPEDSISVVFGVNSQTTPITQELNISLESDQVASSDITVTIAAKNSNIPASLGYLPLTSPDITFPTSVTIAKGERHAKLVITLANTSLLDPVETYAAGFTITQISGGDGVQIVANRQDIVVAFNIKNKYDGVYKGKGYGFLGSNTTAPHLFNFDCSFDVNLITAGPTTVVMDAQPLFRGGTTTYGFSNVIPAFTFDAVTDKVTAVGPAPGSVSFQFPIDGGTYNSRYDPATKTIYVSMGVNNSATWRIIDTLTYCGPRQ